MISERVVLDNGGAVSLAISRPNGEHEPDRTLIEETSYSFCLDFSEALLEHV